MTPEQYLEEANKTAFFKQSIPDGSDKQLVPALYCVGKLCGESGEVAELIFKVLRDNDGIFPEEFFPKLKKELGDVLWYFMQLAQMFGMTFEDIAKENIEKLHSRMNRGKLGGSGSDR